MLAVGNLESLRNFARDARKTHPAVAALSASGPIASFHCKAALRSLSEAVGCPRVAQMYGPAWGDV